MEEDSFNASASNDPEQVAVQSVDIDTINVKPEHEAAEPIEATESNELAESSGLKVEEEEDTTPKNEPITLEAEPEPTGTSASLEEKSEKLQKILERTGYPHERTPTQHIYGPPPGREEEKLPAGVQVHVGRVSYSATEEQLIEVFEQAGEIYELRLMMDQKHPGFKNKGFAFVTFCTKEAADKAVKLFNNYAINGKPISCVIASSNNTLFIGMIPKNKNREEIRLAFSNEVPGIVDVLLQPSLKTAGSTDKNRGFCFLNFEDYKSAAAARQKLRSKIPIRMFDDHKTYTCDWADPQEEISSEVMAQVKTLFVKNISERTTELILRERFSRHGVVDKVVVHTHYAFVFYADRADAVRAIEEENGKELADTVISVELARPVSETHRKKIRELKEKRNEHVPPINDGRGGRGRGITSGSRNLASRMPPGYGYGRDPYARDPYGHGPDPYDMYYGYSGGPPMRAGPYPGYPPRGGPMLPGRSPGGPRGRPLPPPTRPSAVVKRAYPSPDYGAPTAKRSRSDVSGRGPPPPIVSPTNEK